MLTSVSGSVGVVNLRSAWARGLEATWTHGGCSISLLLCINLSSLDFGVEEEDLSFTWLVL